MRLLSKILVAVYVILSAEAFHWVAIRWMTRVIPTDPSALLALLIMFELFFLASLYVLFREPKTIAVAEVTLMGEVPPKKVSRRRATSKRPSAGRRPRRRAAR